MNQQGREIEVKFLISDLGRLEARLQDLGARLVQPRQHELNLRFDTPARTLSNARQVLRLRQDSRARITYKGPGDMDAGACLRQELEFSVSDFDTAWKVLEALGYEITVMYEKYRAAYALGEVEVTLDELPYGNFAEIEGPGGAAIQAEAERLGLDWEARSLDSYLALLNRSRTALNFSFRDLSFANFEEQEVSPADLGLRFADLS
jgi:adenylate cyclase, class 2